ncbi:MAG: class E sortase [Microbacterium sp.]
MTAPEPVTRRSRSRRRRRRTSVVGVLGEILITLGVVALLYVSWQLWIGDLIYGAERADQAHSLSEQWQAEYEATQTATPDPTETGDDDSDVTVPVVAQPADGEIFGTMYIPRFGSDYAFPIAGGVSKAVTLDPIGIGHYMSTQMPGEAGNVALAGHRTTFGKPFNQIADLHVGDAIVIETTDGWYTYRFRTLEYVTPDSSDVLLPVPQEVGVTSDESFLTMTSCSPMYSQAERIVAYSVFESFTPRADGPPASLTEGAS